MFLALLAKRLESNLPKSEQWFRALWRKDGMELPSDKYNQPWCRRIPDLVNHSFKYVIEIDGSIHESKEQKKVDASKDRFYEASGYLIVRVKAYDMESYSKGADLIDWHRTRSTFKFL